MSKSNDLVTMKNRDETIDILRVLGTLLVILAHVTPPKIVSEIRTFDVTMLVFISGMSLEYSKVTNYWTYIKRRFQKLCLPTYLTISIVLILLYIGGKVLNTHLLTTSYVMHSFLLIDRNSIGFVWIVKVYIFIAVLTPVIKNLVKLVRNTVIFYVIGFGSIAFATLIMKIMPYNVITHEYLFYIVQYAMIAAMGLKFVQSNRCEQVNSLVVCIVSFAICQLRYESFCPSVGKYPPQFYYLSYGLMSTVFLYLSLNKIGTRIRNKRGAKVISWMSANSFNIYICHIYYMWGYFLLDKIMPSLTDKLNWMALYVIVVLGACVMCNVIVKIMQNVKNT